MFDMEHVEVENVHSPRSPPPRQASYLIEVAELDAPKDPENTTDTQQNIPNNSQTESHSSGTQNEVYDTEVTEQDITAETVSVNMVKKEQRSTPHNIKDVHSPGTRQASYVIDAAEQDSDFNSTDLSKKPATTPLLSKELTMVTRELSMIARQGTTLSLHGRERTSLSTPPVRTREGLVSRLSILPPAFVIPMLELQFDSVSGVSILLLSFIYQHAPSILAMVEDVAFMPLEADDDDLRKVIDDSLKVKQLMFPRECFPDDLDDSLKHGVKVQVTPVTASDLPNGHASICKSRKSSVNSKSYKGSGRSQRVSAIGDDNENLPMVTPRAILLTPEPFETNSECGSEPGDGNSAPSQTNPSSSVKIKGQVMVCVRPRIDKKKEKNQKSFGEGYCSLQTAMIRDVYRERDDWQGLDFFHQKQKCKQGSVTYDLNGFEEVYVVMETEIWPEVTKQWFKRHRLYWPSLDIINEIKEASCHVSAYPVKPGQDNTFIKQSFYAFPEVDDILFSCLTKTQRTVFLLVSVLYQKHFREPELLYLCHIKAIFFQVCEDTPPDFWRDTDLAICVFHVLNRLINAVSSTDLPHYITNENLLEGANPDAVKEVADMIRLVRKTPIESLVNSSIFGPSDEELFEPILTYIMRDRRYHTTKETLSCIIQAAINVGKTYVPDGRKEQAVAVLDDACSKIFQYRHFSEEAIAMARVTCDLYCDLCDIDKVIEYTEDMAYIAYEYECEHLDLSLCLSRLASLYHCKARQCEISNSTRNKDTYSYNDNELSRESWILKTQEYFELALMEDFSLVSALHFAIYLMKQNNVMEAIVKLTNALALTDESDEAELFADTTTFTLLEVDILDDDLALEVKVMGKVIVPTIAMAYYQLCRALLAAGIERGLDEYLFILQILSDCDDNSHPHTTWALLGYIKRCNKDLHGARQAFEKALSHHKGYYLLRDHLDMYRKKASCKDSACCSIL